VTFDSGGLSLKTTEQMVDMKCDMAGAAAVLAAMQAVATLQVPVNLLGVMALVENMPSGHSMKLGDVLRARNGKTIEGAQYRRGRPADPRRRPVLRRRAERRPPRGSGDANRRVHGCLLAPTWRA